jgi:hypothetical protein
LKALAKGVAAIPVSGAGEKLNYVLLCSLIERAVFFLMQIAYLAS